MVDAYSYLRISSQDQAKGGGIERQMKKTREYALERGLNLIEEMADIGKSGYHGKHRSEGVFGEFLESVKDGTIKAGSVLIVESLDRLSREHTRFAQTQLNNLIEAGIEVVTLIDRRVYNKDVTTGDLIISLIEMERSHKESLTKSERTKSANLRRDKAIIEGRKSYLHQCPKWIKQRKTDNGFVFDVIAEKASIISRIFDLYLSGNGFQKICQILNKGNVPTLGRSKSWTVSSVSFVLRNEMVTGSIKVGNDVFANYLPEIVSPVTFWRVQDRIKNVKGRIGRKGRTYSNLFQGFIVCHHCGEPVIVTRSTGPKKLKYYACSNQTVGGNCVRTGDKRSIPLHKVEDAVLGNVGLYHLDIASVKLDPSVLSTEKNNVLLEIDTLIKSQKNLLASLEFADDDETRSSIVSRLTEIKGHIREKKTKVDVIDSDIREIENALSKKDSIDISGDISAWKTDIDDDSLYQSRQKVNGILKQMVSQIRVDIDLQQVNVVLAGMIKWWNIDLDGKVLVTGDWSVLPLDILTHRAKEFFGKSVDVSMIKKVYNSLDVVRADSSLWDGERIAKGIT